MKTLQDGIKTAFSITKSFEGTQEYADWNFDGQLITGFYLGQTWKQGDLQQILQYFHKINPEKFNKACTVYVPIYQKEMNLTSTLLNATSLQGKASEKWALDRQHNKQLDPQWRDVFHNLSIEPVFIAAQVGFNKPKFDLAYSYCKKYSLSTERGLVLFFDTVVQQGSIGFFTDKRIKFSGYSKADYQQKLEIVAKSVAKQAASQWQSDVLSRRMCIARGAGLVHGRNYNLNKEFDLTDDFI